MGILDEAIREHLELKRQHGADDSELKELEDDAFGPPQRPGAAESTPDPASEAATEFMAQPDLSGVAPVDEAPPSAEGAEPSTEAPGPRREPLADVQEAPQPPAEAEDELPEGAGDTDSDVGNADVEDDGPAEELQPAAEHETVTPPPPPPAGEADRPTAPEEADERPAPASHTTEERHIIADQPTQMFDVAKHLDEDGVAEAPAAPSDEELVEEEVVEPRLGPVEPLGAIDGGDEAEDDEDDDFFDEQRLSDELDQALEAPVEVEEEEDSAEYELEPASDEHEEPVSEEHAAEPDSEEEERPKAAARDTDEDVLEETPDFLEEAPEDDQLWFEQKPPKDFDFDD